MNSPLEFTHFNAVIPAIFLMAEVSTLVGHVATANRQTLTKASVSYQSFDMLSSFVVAT